MTLAVEPGVSMLTSIMHPVGGFAGIISTWTDREVSVGPVDGASVRYIRQWKMFGASDTVETVLDVVTVTSVTTRCLSTWRRALS